MAKLNETVTFHGKSGTKYSFTAYTIDEDCADEAGIYIFAERTAPLGGTVGFYKTHYIGRAQSFQQRFYDHHKIECAKKHGANCILLMQVPDEKQREKIEADLLANYNTSCNEVNN